MKKNQMLTISCTVSGTREMLFFAANGTERIFLFRTNYYDRQIAEIYRSGVSLDTLIRIRYAKRIGKNPFGGVRLQKTRDHILRVLRDYERQTGTVIFRQARKRCEVLRRSAA